MPGNLVNTLYPPQVNTFLPAFVNTQDATIYFSISQYNSSTDIQRVHISLVNQLNNENALNNLSGVIFSPLNFDEASGMYFAVIPTTAVKGNQFNINQFYKVQLRFDTYNGDVPNTDREITSYLLQNQIYFSEWSSVCLIKPILEPHIELRQFDTYTGDSTITFNKGIIPISGKIFFGDNSVVETETLQSFQIQIVEEYVDNVVLQSPVIYTGDSIDPNDINYRIDLQGLNTEDDTRFRLRIIATTKNQYILKQEWNFQISEFLDDESFDPEITAEMDNDEGIATISVRNVQTVFGTIYIKRASSIDNFQNWEDFYIAQVAGDIDLTLEDNTVSSLVWYRYSIQMENIVGALTRVYRSNIIMPEFYEAIFSRGKQQLKIQYNYNISNFKPVVNRAKIDTLGGRFPKFAENAILNYKQFSISGLISSEADVHEKFLNKEDYFDDNYQRYEIYKQDFGVTDLVRNEYQDYVIGDSIYSGYLTTTQNDWLWEREFREEVMKWLNDGEPKLYRSMAEGAMVVMLTDISLTPNATLGRRLYSFSATVYEVAEATSLETLDSLGVFEIRRPETGIGGGEIDPEPEYVEVLKVGQLYQYQVTHNNNIISDILRDLQIEYGAISGSGEDMIFDSANVLSDKIPDEITLKSVKIFFHNKPNIYLPSTTGGSQNLILVRDPANYSADQRSRMMLGYTFNVGTTASDGRNLIFVNQKGYHQLPDNLDITHLSFDNIVNDSGPGDTVTIEYVIVYKEKNNTSTIISGQSVDRTVVGQEEGVFDYEEYIGEQIRSKYNFVKTGEYYQRMQYWRGICLDVEPFAIAHIKYYREDEYNDYIVGETGVLHMLKDVSVQDLCFKGRRMKEQPLSRQRFLEDWEYVLDKSVTDGEGEENNSLFWNEDRSKPVNIVSNNVLQEDLSNQWEIVINNNASGNIYFEAVPNPQRNTVYKINEELKIYYKDQWFDFEETSIEGVGIAHVPIEGMINYYGNVIRSDYS